MKIIKEGVKPENRLWQGTCAECKSVIEAKEMELKIESAREENIGRANCPVCKKLMVFYILPDQKMDHG